MRIGVVVAGTACAGALLLVRCGTSGTSPPDGGSEASTSTDAGQSFPVHAACASPTITTAGPITVDAGVVGPQIAATYGGTEAAVVYIHAQLPQSSVELQRLTQGGSLLDRVTVAGVTQPDGFMGVGAATDGHVYIVCSMTTPSISMRCSSISMATGAVTPGISIAPAGGGSIAYGVSGFVVAYSAPGQPLPTVNVQRLGSDAKAIGSPVMIGNNEANPIVTATSSGYLVTANSTLRVNRLGPDLQTKGSIGFSAGIPFGFAGVAASSDVVGADWIDPDAGAVRGAIATGSTGLPLNIGNTTCTTGSPASVAGGLSSFAFTWSPGDAGIAYGAYDTSGSLLGTALTPAFGAPCAAQTIVAVGDGFLIFGLAQTGLAVFHVGCP